MTPTADVDGRGGARANDYASRHPIGGRPPHAGADSTVTASGGQSDIPADTNPITASVAWQRVTAGTQYLQSLYPGWFARADARAAEMDVRTNYACPWSIAADVPFDLSLDADEVIAFGFVPGDGVVADELNEAWKLMVVFLNAGLEVTP